MLFFSLLVTALFSYLIGGVNGAIITSKYVFKKDIRKHGSGNAGLTNAYRVFGVKGAVCTFLIDTLKAALAIFVGWMWVGATAAPFVGETVAPIIGKLYAGLLVMVGHVLPVWYRFRGGKGVLCCGVTALLIHPLVGLCSWGVFIVVLILTRYVSFGSIIAGGIFFPLFIVIFVHQSFAIMLSVLCGLLIVIMHVPNIVRLVKGKEPKLNFSGRKK